jgi:hypothetical protein
LGARESMEYMLTQIKGKKGRVGGQREHGVKVDTNIRREGKSWRTERAWSKS